jgi:hypothetical protein
MTDEPATDKVDRGILEGECKLESLRQGHVCAAGRNFRGASAFNGVGFIAVWLAVQLIRAGRYHLQLGFEPNENKGDTQRYLLLISFLYKANLEVV